MKLVPFFVVLYLANPIDLVPDFVPLLGYLDDVAVAFAAAALVIRFTPKSAISDILRDLTPQQA